MVEQPEPHPVPDVEGQVAMMSVVVALGILLCLEQMVTYLGEEQVVFWCMSSMVCVFAAPSEYGVIAGGLGPYTTWNGVAWSAMW